MKLRIMTYNICSGKDFRLDSNITDDGNAIYGISACTDVIKEISPDICGINEINDFSPEFLGDIVGETVADQTSYIAENSGLKYHRFGKAISFEGRGDYGNAVISKHPITASAAHLIPSPEVFDDFGYYESRGITEARIDLAGGITVLQIHVGLNVSEKQNAIIKLCELIDSIDTPIVLMGDFNMRPSDWILDKIRERLTDVTPDGEGYIHSFPSWDKTDNVSEHLKSLNPCKIDYIFASRHFKKLSCEVIKARASDHMPMLATLEI